MEPKIFWGPQGPGAVW